MKVLLVSCLFLSTLTHAAGGKITYKYKKYERFDFDALDIEGGNSSPGDLSIGPRFKKKFKNKIPERRNFHREMKKSIDSIL
ncbi:MAG: hypothetical protein HON90_15100 [Halobacteriovoraceae bacterium]|jgi:hypothetical protein|nr:hypothetical protein [Halobacteriovoraceae bacterium]